MMAWASLPMIQKIQRNLEQPDQITFQFRTKIDGIKLPKISLIMQNSNECINVLVKKLGVIGLQPNKTFEKKRKQDLIGEEQ